MEMRFKNTRTLETLHDCFTLASSHKEAIELALCDWLHDVHADQIVKTMDLVKDYGYTRGPTPHWTYLYTCVLTIPGENDRELFAVLLTRYPLQKREHTHAEISRT